MNVLLALPALAALAVTSAPSARPPPAPAAAERDVLLAALLPPPQRVPVRTSASGAGPADEEECGLVRAGSATAAVEDCLACHQGSGSGHPVAMGYGSAAARPGSGLRPEADVVRAGLFLPGGDLRCTTCHDGRSQVAFRLALPPGATLRRAVVPGDPSTYGSPAIIPAAAARGQRVGTTPLCLVCHVF